MLFQIKKRVSIKNHRDTPDQEYVTGDRRIIDVDFCLSEMGGATEIIIKRNGGTVTYTRED